MLILHVPSIGRFASSAGSSNFLRPWTVRVNHQLMVDTDLFEFICHENQQFMKRVEVK